jgi:hypothetical protein
MAENVCFAKVLKEFFQKSFPRRTKTTTKYDPKTFNGKEQNLKRFLIVRPIYKPYPLGHISINNNTRLSLFLDADLYSSSSWKIFL